MSSTAGRGARPGQSSSSMALSSGPHVNSRIVRRRTKVRGSTWRWPTACGWRDYSVGLMIVVTGSTGRVGGLVARRLESGGHPMRLLVRDPGRAPRIEGAQVHATEYGDHETLATGLQKGDRVFMVSLWIGGDVRLDLHRSFIEAAARAEVAQLVYLSFVNAGPNAVFSHAREHGATEAMRTASGAPCAAIRNSMYAADTPA